MCTLNMICVCIGRSVVSDSLQPHGLRSTTLLCPWYFPSKNTGVGYHFLLQGVFPTQVLNPGLLNYKQLLYHLSYEEYLHRHNDVYIEYDLAPKCEQL